MGTLQAKLEKLIATKADLKAALIEQGQTVADDDPFASYADKIRMIEGEGGSATASANVVITNKSGAAVNVFYQNGEIWTQTSLANKGKLTLSLYVGACFYAQDPQGDPLTFISLSGMQLAGTDAPVCSVTEATASASIDIV